MAWRPLECSSTRGEAEREVLSLEPEWVLERVLRCPLAALFLLAFFLLLEVERERDGARSSTIL